MQWLLVFLMNIVKLLKNSQNNTVIMLNKKKEGRTSLSFVGGGIIQ